MKKNKASQKLNVFPENMVWFFALMTMLVTPLFYYTPAIDATLVPKFTFLAAFLLTICLFFFFQREKQLPLTNIIQQKPVILWALFVLVSLLSLIGAHNPYEGIFDISRLILLGLFLISTIYVLRRSHTINPFILASIALAFILSGIGYYQYFSYVFGQTELEALYQVNGIWSHKNVFSGMIFLLIPILLYAHLLSVRWQRNFAAFALLMEICLLMLLQTRSLWLALLFFLIVVFVLIFSIRKQFTASDRKTYLPKLRFLTIIVGLAFVLSYGITRYSVADAKTATPVNRSNETESINSLDKRAASIFDTSTKNRRVRITMWKYTFGMWKDHPILGVGAGNWKLLIGGYYDADYNKTWYHNMRRPHNDFLLILAEKGLAGLLFYLLFLSSFLWITIRILKSDTPIKKKLLAILMMGGIAGFCVDSMFSFPYERLDEQMMMMFFSAVLIWLKLDAAPHIIHKGSKHNAIFIIGAIAFLIFALIAGIKITKAEAAVKKAYTSNTASRWTETIAYIDEAYTSLMPLDPGNNPVLYFRGKAYLNQGNLQKAKIDLENAVEIAPYSVAALTELGILYGSLEMYDKSLEYLSKAITIYPGHRTARLNLGVLYFKIGNYDQSLEMFYSCKTAVEDPSLEAMIREAHRMLAANPENLLP